SAPGPEARYQARESISLAFIKALQLLPPRQRAALILRDVLGFHASEVTVILGTSEESVTSALKRARDALQRQYPPPEQREPPPPGSTAERDLVERLTRAFETADGGDGQDRPHNAEVRMSWVGQPTGPARRPGSPKLPLWGSSGSSPTSNPIASTKAGPSTRASSGWKSRTDSTGSCSSGATTPKCSSALCGWTSRPTSILTSPSRSTTSTRFTSGR